MKIYLDDVRPLPDDSWTPARWPQEVIDLLMTENSVAAISLDHDLGEEGPKARTGYDVLSFIEEQVVVNGYIPPAIENHSANSAAGKRMDDAIEKIDRLVKENEAQDRKWNGSFALPPPYA